MTHLALTHWLRPDSPSAALRLQQRFGFNTRVNSSSLARGGVFPSIPPHCSTTLPTGPQSDAGWKEAPPPLFGWESPAWRCCKCPASHYKGKSPPSANHEQSFPQGDSVLTTLLLSQAEGKVLVRKTINAGFISRPFISRDLPAKPRLQLSPSHPAPAWRCSTFLEPNLPIPGWQPPAGVPAKTHERDDGSCSLLERRQPRVLHPPSQWMGNTGPLWLLTDHGQCTDAGLHRALVLLLQPGALQQPHGGLEKLHHNGLVGLKKRAGRYLSVQ